MWSRGPQFLSVLSGSSSNFRRCPEVVEFHEDVRPHIQISMELYLALGGHLV